jgi:hypothetical protein
MLVLSPSRTGLLAQTPWGSAGSRARCFLACVKSSAKPSPVATRDWPGHRCCLPTDRKGPAVGRIFSELNRPARLHLCLPSLRSLAVPKARGRNGVASAFVWRSFIPVYADAHCHRTENLICRNMHLEQSRHDVKLPKSRVTGKFLRPSGTLIGIEASEPAKASRLKGHGS